MFGTFDQGNQVVTLNGKQTVSGQKNFTSDFNTIAGTFIQPHIEALSTTITPTILSYLSGTSSNIQSQINGNGAILTALDQALQALLPAPNSTTVQFNDTVLVDNPNISRKSYMNPTDIVSLDYSNGPFGDPIVSVISPNSIHFENGNGSNVVGDINVDRAGFYSNNLLDGTSCGVGTIIDNSVSGMKIVTGTLTGRNCHVLAGFEGSAGQDPKLQIRNSIAGALVEVRYDVFLVASDQLSYRFANDTKMFKWDAGTSYRIRANDGTKISVDDAILVSNTIGNIDFKHYVEYLDASGQGGFTVYICNPGNLPDPYITSPDILFVSGQIGGAQNSFTLPKWTVARFILTPTDPTCGYPYDFVWMLSYQ